MAPAFFRVFHVCLILLCACARPQPIAETVKCDAAVRTGTLPDVIDEASGVAISRRNPGILWVHNDDSPIILYALDSSGALKGHVRVSGIDNADFEDIAIASCGSASCLYIGDIGDNAQKFRRRVVYRIPEPLVSDTVTAVPVAFPFEMPGKAQDAEALFVTPAGRIYIISKGRSGPIVVYEFPSARPDTVTRLIPVYQLSAGLVQVPEMVTGAGMTPDGRYIVMRTYSSFQLYTLRRDTLKTVLAHAYDLSALQEPQGEGVDIDDNGTVYFVSEKGLSDSAPPLSRVQCHLPAS